MVFKAATFSLALLTLSVAHSAPMTYNYTGTCTEECSRIGLNVGDEVSGWMTAGDGFADDGYLFGSELEAFSFTFGTVIITDALHTALGVLKLNPDLTIDYSALAGGITFQRLSSGATTGNIGGLAGWTARSGLHVAGGPGSYAPVPEPATLALLGLGLAAIGAGSRRKLKGRRSAMRIPS